MQEQIVARNTNNKNLTFQEYQSIYSELTLKSENLEKQYAKSFTLIKNNISHLQGLLDDILRQYDLVSKNSNITVYQLDSTKKIYSSIENFLAVETTAKATEQIIIEYNLLVNVPNINKKQNYKIIIRIVSDLVTFERVRQTIPLELIDLVEKKNIEVKIEYIDYTIAKSILNTVDEWIEDISEKDNSVISFAESYKNVLAIFIKNSIVLFSFLLVFKYIPTYIPKENPDMQIVTEFFLISFAIIYFSSKISVIFSNVLRMNLAYLENFSAIQLTEQDNKNIKEQKNKKSKRLLSVFSTIVLTIIYGIVSSVIASEVILK